MELFDQSLTVMEKSLDLHMANQRLVSSNLANVDTPGYKAQRIDFEASMDKAIQEAEATPAGEPTPPATPIIFPSAEPSLTLDGNNINLETELSELSRNKLMYSLTSQIVAAKLRQLSTVITSQP